MTMETQIHLNAGDSGLTLNELKSISRRLMQDFPFELHHPDDEAFREGARLRFACLLVNVGVDPLAEFSRRGLQLVSDQNDPIAYGNQQLNLALTFDLITLNSWGEISLSRYSKDNALISCLSDWLSMLPTDASHNPQINVLCYSKNKAESIVRRINQLLSELTNAFYEHQQEGALRYILKVSEQYQLLEVQEQAIEVQAFDNESTLTTALSWPRFQYSPLKVDSLALSKSPLASIYQTNRPNKIQLFFLPYQDQADVWILDEASTLFHKQEPFHTKQHLLNPYRRFLQSVIYRQSIIGNTALDPTIEIHQLSDPKEPGSDWPIKQLQMSDDVGMSPYLTIQAIISADYAENPMLSFYFADEEFSTLEHGDKLFEVLAECIMERRQGDLTYPAYVTDLDISTLELKERQVTSQYLSIKSDLEKQITYALEKLGV